MSEKKQLGYSTLIKGASIFGSVQIMQILTQVLKNKLIAIFVGPSGIGLNGLFNNAISLITTLYSLGISSSAVKDISVANSSYTISRVATIVMKTIFISSVIAFLTTVFFSQKLSRYFFADDSYTVEFVIVSFCVFFTLLSSGFSVILQGLNKLKLLALVNFYGSLFGLVFTIPLVYFFKLNGIVSSILLSSIITFIFFILYIKKIKINTIKVSFKDLILEGKGMIKMGIVLSVSTILNLLISSYLRIVINKSGGLIELGLYTASFSIVSVYLSSFFSAMGMDYYPKLASVSHSNDKSSLLISQQTELVNIIFTPVLIFFFSYVDLGIILFFSKDFLGSQQIMIWAALGMFFKAITWPMGYLLVVKRDLKYYFWNEFLSNCYLLIFSIFLYKYVGVEGLGIAFFLSYFITYFQVLLILKFKYNYTYNLAIIKLFLPNCFLLFLSFYINLRYENVYFLSSFILFSSIIYSFLTLNSRISILDYLKAKKK